MASDTPSHNIAIGSDTPRQQGRAVVPLPPAAATTYSVNRQRIPVTIDPLSPSIPADAVSPIQSLRIAATQKIYPGAKQIRDQLPEIITVLKSPVVPSPLVGQLLEPNGRPASTLQVEFDPAQTGGHGPVVTAITASDGTFRLAVPRHLTFPSGGLKLKVCGADTPAPLILAVARDQVAANGYISNLKLPNAVAPLPVSIVASLTSLLDSAAPASAQNGNGTGSATIPTVTIGEDGGCQLKFEANSSVERFPYSVFFRLIEPQLSSVNTASQVPDPVNPDRVHYLPNYVQIALQNAGGVLPAAAATPTVYGDRIPVEQPISVDGFRDNIMGLGTNGKIGSDETVPMAATLGLGYMLRLAHKWTLKGLGLGDLVYSLPLAPGEQQQLAVFERTDIAHVFESETFDEQEAQRQRAVNDTSTLATFNSAILEMQAGGSKFSTNSENVGFGFARGISAIVDGVVVGAGSALGIGVTGSAGNTSQWLQGSLDTAQTASQHMHSAAESHARARRTAARTGMRIATASETESITTTTITNHNHTRSLTMQYWEVLRLYDVTTEVDGVTLTALIPLQVVRFLPPGQPLTLAAPLGTRAEVLTRYDQLLKYIDVLQQAVPRQYRYSLTLLRQFASDPTAVVAPSTGAAEEVINFTLVGSFVACERVYVSAVTRRNTRVGPVQVAGAPAIAADTYASEDALLAALSDQRTGGLSDSEPASRLTGSLALPQTMNRNDIVGFEISRNFVPLDYTLKGQTDKDGLLVQGSVHLMPSELENALAGPRLDSFSANIVDPTGASTESYASVYNIGVQLPQRPYSFPAQQLAPLLHYNELLEIEKTAQHVVRNTVDYSKAVWLSMTAEERAILFEGYTIGVPQGGISDWTQMIPLLNCIENRVLGFFGNSMIVPFRIPPIATAEDDGLTTAQVQEALLAYYNKAFVPPVSNIALPTRGVLGEAVLGHCPAAEKIDITRFWNWADSPARLRPSPARCCRRPRSRSRQGKRRRTAWRTCLR